LRDERYPAHNLSINKNVYRERPSPHPKY